MKNNKCKHCGNSEHDAPTHVNRNYDVPYLAGYNNDGTIIYIDRKIPATFVDSLHKTVNVYRYLIIHETCEKNLIHELGFSYNEAHSIAMGAEMQACTMDRVNYDEYYGFIQQFVNFDIKPEDFDDVPPDLDITPYVDDGLTDVVAKIKKLQGKK